MPFDALESALQHFHAGDFASAIALCRQVLASQPKHPTALNLLGMALVRSGDLPAAINAFRAALIIDPNSADALNNLGWIYKSTARFDEAIDCCRRLIAIAPGNATAHKNLATTLADAGQIPDALTAARQAITLDPNNDDLHNTLATILELNGDLDGAAAEFETAYRLNPNPRYLGFRGNVYLQQGSVAQAVDANRNATDAHAKAFGDNHPATIRAHSNYLLSLNYDPTLTPQHIFAEHQRWAEVHERPLRARAHNHRAHDRSPDRPLRIGFHAQYFGITPAVTFMESTLAAHDREQDKFICYSDVLQPDATTHRLLSLHDESRDIARKSDDEVVELIVRDNIDILVDLNGHLGGNRLPLFARKPAPIQISFLNYPNTTGLHSIDYYLTDAIVDPPDQPNFFTEQLVRLRTFCCFTPPPNAPAVQPRSSSDPITFGSLHMLAKLNTQVLDLWADLLREISNSRLLILRDTCKGQTRQRLLDQFTTRGLDPSRLDLRSDFSESGYLAAYHNIDIALDTFPWSGHTIACDGLWMGVPIITLPGPTHASRMVAAVLTHVGLPQFIAADAAAYITIAKQLAADRAALASLRQTLREQMRNSSLCNAGAFVLDLQSAFRTIWRKWCSNSP